MYKSFILALGILSFSTLFFSCSGKVDLKNVNLENWKNDRDGCIGLRMQELEAFRVVKNDLLGKDNQSIIKTFGRPDKVELTDRSQSFFMYFIDPAPSCDNFDASAEQPMKVMLRMNAYSRVSEVVISRLDP
ncbi:hypothetical protein MMU07_14505 [Aquiflexum sp. LQ15W]|uniref:hypothetical protein n=1 Tax=Cognataquiflexum nitidum TaxID=2922272 RepID=UPI001F12ECAE|nr:hypothetical protein [Cognataquiflexum nitidum]MCH6200793.1 hypothetical protein [Cognataquiflexum nitidum]